jgi:hypothetical protein
MKSLLIACILLFSASVNWSCHNTPALSTTSGGLPTSIINVPVSASSQTNGKLPVIHFADTNYDFGDIKEGDTVSHSYTFTNKGTIDLVITAAKGTCGCTIAQPPKDAIPPGGSGSIHISFNSAGKEGKVVKGVFVTSNCTPNTSYLTFTANILPTNP